MADYSTLLRNHVTLTGRSIDRICLQAYVPKLQTVGLVCQYLRWQRGYCDPVIGSVREDRRRLYCRCSSVRRRARHPGALLRQG